MIPETLLHPTEKLSWLAVAKFLATEELLHFALLRNVHSLDDLCFENIIGVFYRGSNEEVPDSTANAGEREAIT